MFRRWALLIVGSLLIIAMIAFVTVYRSSPGDLAAAHAAVAGSPLITDCKKCHASQGLTAGCLKCHTEILDQLKKRAGYHAYLAQQKKTECGPCHSDHNGKTFELVNKASWENKDPKNFTHPEAVFRLSGKHQGLACEKCHSARFVPPFTLPKFAKFPRKSTYLGLSQRCIRCHEDVHAHGLASECANCHGQVSWKPTTPFFDHDKFFSLKGGHANLKCNQCHILPARRPLHFDLKKFPFEKVKGTKCVDCHANPHHAQFRENCEACHKGNDKTWAVADPRMTQAQHAETGFPLSVPHNHTTCAECHAPQLSFILKYPDPRKRGYKRFEKNCEACHKDAHLGQFVKTHTHCMDCHSRVAFMPSTYGVSDHTTYPLVGGHLTASCNLCHLRDRATHVRQYVPTPKACAACHKDIHYGQFRQPDKSNVCETCHRTTVSWSKIVFNHNTQSRFKLDAAHIHVACNKCHPRVTVRGVQLIQYKPLRFQCRDCHDFDH